MLDNLRSLTGRPRPNYEPLSTGRTSVRRPLQGFPTSSTLVVLAVVVGLCFVVLYSTSNGNPLASGDPRNVQLSSGNGFRASEPDPISGVDSSQLEIPIALLHGKSSRIKNRGPEGSCFLFDENTGKDNGVENRVWHYREDYFLHSFHYFWHMYNDLQVNLPVPDRAGELFYFMHHEVLARYFNDRWSAGLSMPSLLKFQNVTLVAEGYNPHLTAAVVGNVPPPRPPNQYVRDVTTQTCNTFNISLNGAVEVQRRLYESIKLGYIFKDDGSKIPINGLDGVNILAQVMYRRNGYPYWLEGVDGYQENNDGFHGMAHILVGAIMDPTGAKHLCLGAISVKSTPLYDPVFFRLHGWMNDLLVDVKKHLESYSPLGSDFPLLWKGVRVLGAEVKETGNKHPNLLHTHWTMKVFNAPFGLDWNKNASEGPVPICKKQLNHKEFHYKIIYENHGPESLATVRIFMSSRFNNTGNRLLFDEQHKRFFTMDRFRTTLKPGKNEIIRSSLDSSLTLPDDTWLGMEDNGYNTSYCGCGLPQHLLVPKGTQGGKLFDLFVMLTNGTEDVVEDDVELAPGQCQNAQVWCLNYGMKYPDKRPMGYPFDRVPYKPRGKIATYLDDWMEGIGNMHTTQVKIKHLD